MPRDFIRMCCHTGVRASQTVTPICPARCLESATFLYLHITNPGREGPSSPEGPAGQATCARARCLPGLRPAPRICVLGRGLLTECSSWSTLCARTGLNDTGDRAPGFFLTARICSRARKAGREEQAGERAATPAARHSSSSAGEPPVLAGSREQGAGTTPKPSTVVWLLDNRTRYRTAR